MVVWGFIVFVCFDVMWNVLEYVIMGFVNVMLYLCFGDFFY